MPPSTVDGIILIGWMERAPAIQLLQECVFEEALSEEAAEKIWRKYREAVEALPERDTTSPAHLTLDKGESEKAAAFLKFHGVPQNGGSIREVIKINPMNLVTHQPYICLDRVQQHLAGGDARDSLCTILKPHQLTWQFGINFANFQVPHGEFAFLINPQTGQLMVNETARHVSVTEFQGRTLLWAGYHRSYALMVSENPDGIERSMLVALTTDADFFVSEQSPNQGLRAMVCGLRPPLFRDFFDDRFFMKVKLRKKRYELQIRAQCVGVNMD